VSGSTAAGVRAAVVEPDQTPFGAAQGQVTVELVVLCHGETNPRVGQKMSRKH